MQVTKNLGYLYDIGEYITLPITATVAGKYKIRVKRPVSREVQRIYEAEVGEDLKIPNHNGRKTLEDGLNIIYVYTPDGKRLIIDGANKFEVFFERIERTSNNNDKSFIHEIVQASSIWEVDNPQKRPFMVVPENLQGVDIDCIDQSTPQKVIINWKFIPRKGFIQFY